MAAAASALAASAPAPVAAVEPRAVWDAREDVASRQGADALFHGARLGAAVLRGEQGGALSMGEATRRAR